jgi:tripartite-type tricarboxylate transporter receptor subunit TctC
LDKQVKDMIDMNAKCCVGLCAALIATILPVATRAEPAGNFYAGKTVTLIIGSGVGGSYDTGGRLVAQYLKKYIPGNPNVVPQNMPGASSVRAAEYVFNAAPHDGTTLGFIQPTVVLNKVLEPSAKYDPRGLIWIGRLQRMVFIGLARSDAPAHSVEEAKTHELVLAANAPTGPAVMVPMALNALIGTKFKTVRGYQSAADNFLAMQRGEVQGIGSTGLADIFSRPDLVENKLVNVLYVIDLVRSPKIPDVRTIVELGKSEDDRKILALLGNASSIGQAVMTPPDVPEERAAVLRQAFAAMMKDPQFIADAEKREIDPSWLAGPELQKLVAENFTTSPALVEKLKTITSPPR